MNFESDSPVHIEPGEALDQETILRLKPLIIEEVAKTVDFDRTELFWNMLDNNNFQFEIHFFKNV